jgi:hypothetical protein
MATSSVVFSGFKTGPWACALMAKEESNAATAIIRAARRAMKCFNMSSPKLLPFPELV